MTWAKDKEISLRESAELIPVSPNARGVKVKLRGSPHEVDQVLFGGFLGRTFLELVSPAQLLELVRGEFLLKPRLACERGHDKPTRRVPSE